LQVVAGQVIPGVGAVLEDQGAEVIDIPSLRLAYIEIAHLPCLFQKAPGSGRSNAICGGVGLAAISANFIQAWSVP
jgi:hypothetical protein